MGFINPAPALIFEAVTDPAQNSVIHICHAPPEHYRPSSAGHGLPLVVGGDTREYVRHHGSEQMRLIGLDGASREDLPALYLGAELFLFVSR